MTYVYMRGHAVGSADALADHHFHPREQNPHLPALSEADELVAREWADGYVDGYTRAIDRLRAAGREP